MQCRWHYQATFDKVFIIVYDHLMMKQDINLVFGEQIKTRRRELGLTLQEVSEKSGLRLTRSAISSIENGRQQVTLNQFFRLADALSLVPEVLVSELLKKINFELKKDHPILRKETRTFIENI
jgi:transcriptional regulator with XRE-family HTH domain